MFYSPDTNTRFVTHSDIRNFFNNVSLPKSITQTVLDELRVFALVSDKPSYDKITTTVYDDGVVFSDGSWRIKWVIADLPSDQITANQAAAVQRLQDEVVFNTQKRLDDFAKTRNYDGILSAASYAVSSHPPFADEGRYCADARDATWGALYTIMSEVQAGTRPMPSGYAEVEPLLPVLEWPSS